MTEQKAQEWLQANLPHIKVLEWGGKAKSTSTFYNVGNGNIFKYNFTSMKIHCKEGHSIGLTKDELREKSKKGCLVKYGVENPFQAEEIKAKIKESTLEKYGVEHHLQSKEVLEKQKKTNLKRYGVKHTLQAKEIKAKIKKTNLKRYGVENPFQAEEIKAKIKESRIASGNIHLIEGKTLQAWSDVTGRAVSGLNILHNKGIDITKLSKKETAIEFIISQFLDSINISYIQNKKLPNTSYRPDFLIPDHNLIIECDGLYWHSDSANEDKNYHQDKKQAYTQQGYRSLFFRENELLNQIPIVQSIITNALNLNTTKIFARKCTIQELDPTFFSKYHLMGKGAGRAYGLFFHGEPILGIQMKWVNKQTKLLDISRLCSAPNTSVVGGFSKLLKHVEKVEQPKSIQTFIDKRYGEGLYLKGLRFQECNTHLSFKWTDFKQTYNRMQFKGNTGYEYGLYKIWDCGQTKWIKL